VVRPGPEVPGLPGLASLARRLHLPALPQRPWLAGAGSALAATGASRRWRARPGRNRLRGHVEVDESFRGGPEPGVPGRGALGKVLFAGAVELDESGFGRARLGVIPNASSVSPEHVQAYVDEWVFRFNRRHSRSRGLLFHTLLRQAVEGEPVTYRSLSKAGRTRPAPQPARGARQLPPSLDVGGPELPWRERPGRLIT